MPSRNYQGVILAAGHGTRMGPFGERVPKPIAPIANRPLLAYQIDAFKAMGIHDITIVIGHLGHRIQEQLGDGAALGVKIHYVEQTERLGLAHAVGQLEAHIRHPFVLMLGDIFFQIPDPALLVREFEEHPSTAVLAVMEERDPAVVQKNFAVYQRDDATVRRVVEKPRHIPSTELQKGPLLKGCGIYLFDLPIFDAIRRTPRTAMRDEYELTESIQMLIDYNEPVRVAPIVEWDMNVTDIGDLIACNVRQLGLQHQSHAIGDGCDIPDGATLHHSAVGNNVTIRHPIRLERCIVLDNAVIEDEHDLYDLVITEDAKLTTELEV